MLRGEGYHLPYSFRDASGPAMRQGLVAVGHVEEEEADHLLVARKQSTAVRRKGQANYIPKAHALSEPLAPIGLAFYGFTSSMAY